MRRRVFIAGIAGAAAWPLAAQAQHPSVRRIGFLGNSTADLEANLVDPFRDGLRMLGLRGKPRSANRISLGGRRLRAADQTGAEELIERAG